jgi:DNA-binding PucR family transcriptional regulator
VPTVKGRTAKLVWRTQFIESCRARIDDLASRYVDVVWQQLPGYEPSRVQLDDLTDVVTHNLHSLLDYVLDPDSVGEEEEDRAREVGSARALQEVPLDTIVLSFRAAERLLWEEFVQQLGPTHVAQLQVELRNVARACDWLQSIMIDAYRQTQEQLTVHNERLGSDLLSMLVLGHANQSILSRHARLLGLDLDGCYQIAAFAASSTVVEDLLHLRRQVVAIVERSVGRRITSGTVRGCELLLIPGGLGEPAVTELRTVLDRARRLNAYITLGAAVDGLPAAGDSGQQALQAMEVVQGRVVAGSLHGYDELLLDVLVSGDAAAAGRLHDVYHAAIDGQTHLEETLLAFLGANLSIRDAAASLFVHPNTIVYRLERVRALTGIDPRDAWSLVHFVLAVRACSTATAGMTVVSD